MTPEKFVANLKLAVLDDEVASTLGHLLKPPGRRPDLRDKPVADWYERLSESDRRFARRLAELCAEGVFFGVLAVLDNVRAMEGQGPKGELKLVFSKAGESRLLNDPTQEPLHDIFQSLNGTSQT